MMGKRLLSLLTTSAALGLVMGQAEAKTVIQVMHQGDPGWVSTYGEVAKRFEAANPDVDIELIYAPHDAYNEKFSAAVMSAVITCSVGPLAATEPPLITIVSSQ